MYGKERGLGCLDVRAQRAAGAFPGGPTGAHLVRVDDECGVGPRQGPGEARDGAVVLRHIVEDDR